MSRDQVVYNFYVDVFYVNISYIHRLKLKQYRNMSNKKDLYLSIFEFATQFKLLISFIIARDYHCRTGTFRQFSRDFGCHTAISG